MFRKDPPYDRFIKIALIVLVILWMVRRVAPGFLPGGITGFMNGFSVVALLSCLLAAYKAYKEFKAGYLYPLRTISFYLTGFAVVLAMIFLVYDMVARTGEVGEGLFILAFLAGFYTQSMPYLYLDSVRVEHRLGFTTTILPVFNVTETIQEKDALILKGNGGEEIGVFRGQFSAASWSELRTRVSALTNERA